MTRGTVLKGCSTRKVENHCSEEQSPQGIYVVERSYIRLAFTIRSASRQRAENPAAIQCTRLGILAIPVWHRRSGSPWSSVHTGRLKKLGSGGSKG